VAIEDYKNALDAACREFEQLLQQRADLEKRLDQLHETIASLTRLCGYEPTVPLGVTDAVRLVLRRIGAAATPLEVRDRLRAIGFDLSKYSNDLSAIHTVLKRLQKAGELHVVPQPDGGIGYRPASIKTVVLDNPSAQIPFGVFTAPWTRPRNK
jgi:hypothetical protein